MTPDAEADVAFAGVTGQARLLAEGALTASDLVELVLRRIEARADLNAFRVVLADEARAAAADADAARRAGDDRPLLGVPVAVKDNVAAAGQRSLLGTASPEPVATADDELVARLRAAGMVVVGRTHLPELALWAATESAHHGITRNPWDRGLAPGGSSGGSAAAVAAGLVPAAHATDGLGSIRLPATACGLVGLKPTHGTVPLGPDPDHWEGMSHAGFVTRSVLDTATLLDAVVDPTPGLVGRLDPPPPLRVAVSVKPTVPTRVDPRVRAVLDAAVGALRDLGHTVVHRDPPYGAVGNANAVRYLAGLARDLDALADPAATERRTRQLAAVGRRLPDRLVGWARHQGEAFGERMGALFGEVDVLVTPTCARLPVPAGSIVGRNLARTLQVMLPMAGFTGSWNGCGLPAVSVPFGTADGAVPVGVQIVGPRSSEPLLLALAAALERVSGWTDRRPPGS